MQAIVYTSNTGHTKKYAELLGELTNWPVYPLKTAKKQLKKHTPIIYLGWLFVGSIKGYKQASKQFDVKALCGVGLCDTGCMLDEIRKNLALSDNFPLFTMQGGIDKQKLRGINKFMIKMLIKMLSNKKDKTADDNRMIELLLSDTDYVCINNTQSFQDWYKANNNA